MLFDLSQWIFSKYQIYIIFYYKWLKILVIKVVYWHVCNNWLPHVFMNGQSTIFICKCYKISHIIYVILKDGFFSTLSLNELRVIYLYQRKTYFFSSFFLQLNIIFISWTSNFYICLLLEVNYLQFIKG